MKKLSKEHIESLKYIVEHDGNCGPISIGLSCKKCYFYDKDTDFNHGCEYANKPEEIKVKLYLAKQKLKELEVNKMEYKKDELVEVMIKDNVWYKGTYIRKEGLYHLVKLYKNNDLFQASDNSIRKREPLTIEERIDKLELEIAEINGLIKKEKKKDNKYDEIVFNPNGIYEDSYGYKLVWMENKNNKYILYSIENKEYIKTDGWTIKEIMNCINDKINKHKYRGQLLDIVNKGLEV
jgi:hypothetical protein